MCSRHRDRLIGARETNLPLDNGQFRELQCHLIEIDGAANFRRHKRSGMTNLGTERHTHGATSHINRVKTPVGGRQRQQPRQDARRLGAQLLLTAPDLSPLPWVN